MHLIFGREAAQALAEKYTLLELDTVKFGDPAQEVAVFCAIETIPIIDMLRVESMKDLHQNLMLEYRKQNWNYCLQALEHLMGFWNQELDTFYSHLQQRIDEYVKNPPGEAWTGVIDKTLIG